MWGLPVGLLVKVGLALALAAAVAFGVHAYNERLRETGRSEVRVKWDAERAAQKAAQEAQEAAWREQGEKTAVATRERDDARKEAFKAVAERSRLAAEVARLRVPAAAVDSLRASVDAANAAGAAGGSGGSAASVTRPAGVDTTLGAVNEWFRDVAEVHAECRDRVAAWVEYYNGLRAAQGAP